MDTDTLRRAVLRKAIEAGIPKADVTFVWYRCIDDGGPAAAARIFAQALEHGIGTDAYRAVIAGDEAGLHAAYSAGLGPVEAVGLDMMAKLADLSGGRLIAPLPADEQEAEVC